MYIIPYHIMGVMQGFSSDPEVLTFGRCYTCRTNGKMYDVAGAA